jgi:hypothetical protein
VERVFADSARLYPAIHDHVERCGRYRRVPPPARGLGG